MCKGMCGPAGCVGSKIMWVLLIVGGLNWGLVGAFDFDLVMVLFGSVMWLADLVYILVGLSALVVLLGGCKCKSCKGTKGGCCGGMSKPAMPMEKGSTES